MAELSPKLLKACRDDFAAAYKSNKQISAIANRIRDGTASMSDASKFSSLIGELLGKAMSKNITFDVLPEQTLFWNIAQDVIKPLIEDNFTLVSACSRECMKIAYKSAGVGIQVKKPKVDAERLKGLLDNACAAQDSEQLSFRLEADTRNITESYYDDFVYENADASESVGMTTKVIRDSHSKCCDWCASLDGEYNYDDVKDKGNDVWRRHVNCTCTIEYVTEKSREKVQNYRRIDVTRGKRVRR